MTVFLQVVVNGIAVGSLYGMLALSLVMVWKATGVLNFAQAEIALFGTFVAWSLMTALRVPFVAAALCGVLVSCVVALVIERLTIRPLVGESHFATVLMTLGLLFAINALTEQIWGAARRSLATPLAGSIVMGGLRLDISNGIAIAAGALIAIALNIYFRSAPGIRMRAIAVDAVTPRLLGISIGRVYQAAWLIASAIALVAVLLFSQRTVLSTSGTLDLITLATIAATVGGFSSPTGAYFGGLVLGLLTTLGGYYLLTGGEITIALLAVVAVLAIRPQGIFGGLGAREV